MSNTLARIREEVEQKRAALYALLDTPREERSEDYAAKSNSLQSDLAGLAADLSAAEKADLSYNEAIRLTAQKANVEEAMNLKAATGEPQKKGISLEDFRAAMKSQGTFDGISIRQLANLKATTRADMGIDPAYEELNLKPVYRPAILDFLPSAQTTQNSVTYRRGVAQNGAAPRLESQSLAAINPTASKITDPIEAIGCFLDVSVEELQDDAQFSLVLDEMGMEVRRELAEQAIIGNGTSPNLRGITTTASPQTEVYATSRLQTTVNAMMALQTTERANPALFGFRPSDWALVYGDILSVPSSAVSFVQNGLVPLLHGVPVITDENLTSGVGMILDPSLYAVIYNQGLTIESSNSDGVKFRDLTVSYRAYVRAALKTRRLGVRLIDLTA